MQEFREEAKSNLKPEVKFFNKWNVNKEQKKLILMFVVRKNEFANTIEMYFKPGFSTGLLWRFAYSRAKIIGYGEKSLI